MAAMSGARLRKKVRHPWLGGPRRLTMYLATLDCATSNPSLSSSPGMRGAPQSGFSTFIRRISTRRSVSICGRPPRARDFQVAAKARPVPTHKGLGPDNCENLQDCWKPAIELDKEPSIMVREPDATMQPAPQDNQLMSTHRVLSFKPQLRLKWRGQDGQNETEQPDHSASLVDSITSSTQIRFSVHTPAYLEKSKPPENPQDLLSHRLLAFAYFKAENSWTFHHVNGKDK